LGRVCRWLKRAKGLKDEICRKVEGVVWKARDGDGRTDLNDGEEESFLKESFVYIGRGWQHRKNKELKTLYRT